MKERLLSKYPSPDLALFTWANWAKSPGWKQLSVFQAPDLQISSKQSPDNAKYTSNVIQKRSLIKYYFLLHSHDLFFTVKTGRKFFQSSFHNDFSCPHDISKCHPQNGIQVTPDKCRQVVCIGHCWKMLRKETLALLFCKS